MLKSGDCRCKLLAHRLALQVRHLGIRYEPSARIVNTVTYLLYRWALVRKVRSSAYLRSTQKGSFTAELLMCHCTA